VRCTQTPPTAARNGVATGILIGLAPPKSATSILIVGAAPPASIVRYACAAGLSMTPGRRRQLNSAGAWGVRDSVMPGLPPGAPPNPPPPRPSSRRRLCQLASGER